MVPIPDSSSTEAITTKLDALTKAIEQHPEWTPPKPHPSLFHLWDFIKRSHYIMTELDNIRNGREVKHPEQIPKNEGAKDNEEKAQMSFTDVVTRTLTINKIIETPSMMVAMGMQPVDLTDGIKQAAKEVEEAIMAVPE